MPGVFSWSATAQFAGRTITLEPTIGGSVAVGSESVSLTVTELTTPANTNGYQVNDDVRFLVQVSNTGTIPVTVDLTLADSTAGSGGSAFTAALAMVELPAGATIDRTTSYRISASDVVGGVANLRFGVGISGGSPVMRTVQIRVSQAGSGALPQPPPPPTPPKLPVTGNNSQPVVALAAFAIFAGLALTTAARRRRASPNP